MTDAPIAMRAKVRVALLFFVFLGLFNGVYQVEKRVSGRYLDLPYTSMVTSGAEFVAQRVLPIPVERRGIATLGTGCTAVVIRGGCNGIEAVFLLVAGILAYPASWFLRCHAFLIYLPVLFVLNLLRIVTLLYVMAEHQAYIHTFHDQIAQGILVVSVFGMWVHYIYWIERQKIL